MTFNQRKTIKGRIRWAWYRFLWKIAPHFPLPFPVHVDIEINSSCNLRCVHCHQTDTPRKYALNKLTKSEAIEKLDEAKRIGAKSIKLNHKGESLIHADFWGILAHALKLDFTDILINTNLSVKMTDDQIRMLAMVPSIKVSIDSVVNYAKVRVGGDRDLVFDNIVRLFEHRDYLETNRHETTETERFWEYRRQFFWELVGAKCRIFSGWGEDDYTFPHCNWMFDRIKMRNAKALPRNSSGVFIGGKEGVRKYCGQPSRRLLMSASTRALYPCCAVYDDKETDMQIGPPDAGFAETWNGQKRKDLIRDLKAGRFKTKSCENCMASDAWK